MGPDGTPQPFCDSVKYAVYPQESFVWMRVKTCSWGCEEYFLAVLDTKGEPSYLKWKRNKTSEQTILCWVFTLCL